MLKNIEHIYPYYMNNNFLNAYPLFLQSMTIIDKHELNLLTFYNNVVKVMLQEKLVYL